MKNAYFCEKTNNVINSCMVESHRVILDYESVLDDHIVFLYQVLYHAGVHDMRMFICQSPVFFYILGTAFFLFLRHVYSLQFDRICVFNIYHDSLT